MNLITNYPPGYYNDSAEPVYALPSPFELDEMIDRICRSLSKLPPISKADHDKIMSSIDNVGKVPCRFSAAYETFEDYSKAVKSGTVILGEYN